MVQSILNQTLPADEINLYISKDVGVLNKGINTIPDFLQKLAQEKKLNIIYTQDVGPHTKLIPCLKDYWQKDCVIITFDDDIIYPDYVIKQLYETYLQENCIVCFRGSRITFDDLDKLSLKNYRDWPVISGKHELNFLKGVGGVIYHPKFFTKKVFDINSLKKYCPHNDDIWFKLNSMINNVPVYVLGNSFTRFPSINIVNKKELWTQNRKGRVNKQFKNSLDHFISNKLISKTQLI